jgi:hypothetical protein
MVWTAGFLGVLTSLGAQTPGAAPPGTATLNQAQLCDLPLGARPVVIESRFHLTNINKIDDEAETFEFSGVLTLVWRDSRQAFDPAVEGVKEKFYHGAFQFNELSPGWYPQVVLANSVGIPETQGLLLRVAPDGTSTLIQTVNAVSRTVLNLRRYPFDRQRLEAVFEVLGFDSSDASLQLDTGAVSSNLAEINVPQWSVTSVGGTSREIVSPYAGASGHSSALIVSVEVRRQSFFMVRLVVFPLILIVFLSWTVFWMDRSSLGDRMSVSFVGLLTAVAYQIVVGEIMPQISYMTWMNGFLNFSLWIMGASIVINLIVAGHDGRGDSTRGYRIDRRCRIIFPLVYAALLTVCTVAAFTLF